MGKVLIAYFSATGATAKLAATLARASGGELYEIRPAVPYTASDLDWRDKHSRSTREMEDKNARPALAGPLVDTAPYDMVLVGFPIWWYEAPRVVQSFLEGCALEGKRVVPFATSGGSGLGDTASILQRSCPGAQVLPGKRLSASASVEEVSAWLESLGV